MAPSGSKSRALAVWLGCFVISQCLLSRQEPLDDFVAMKPYRNTPRPGLRSAAANSEDAPAAPQLEAGGRAMLTGFTERTSLNGEPVELIRFDEEQQSWVVRRQSEQSITSLVSLKNLMPYPEKKSPEKPKDREFSPVSFLATIIASVILLATALAVLVPTVSGIYKDMTGEYLYRLDVPSLYCVVQKVSASRKSTLIPSLGDHMSKSEGLETQRRPGTCLGAFSAVRAAFYGRPSLLPVSQKPEMVAAELPELESDGSGTIDRDELAAIMYKVSSSMSQRDITRLLAVIDTNQDGLIDFREFVAWITDRRADRTVGNDGWIERFDVKTLLRPMFEVFDRNKDGLILRAELEECSQILGNSLSIHPSSAPDCLAMDWKQLPSNETVSFQQFVDWQVGSLEKCGDVRGWIPLILVALSPHPQLALKALKSEAKGSGFESSFPFQHLEDTVRLEELCESLQIIFDIDRLHGQGVENSRVHEALTDSVKKVADATRRIYTKKLS
ncbi:unnamed protein product, partial [Symbiodinium pilosum]